MQGVRCAALVLLGSLCGCAPSGDAGDAADAAAAADAAVVDAARPDAFVADAAEVSTTPTVQPGCTENGCVRQFASILTFSKEAVIGILNDPDIVVENGLSSYLITFMSEGREVNGTVIVPDSAPPADGFATIVNMHGAVGIGPGCAPSLGILGLGLGGGPAVRGFLVIVPDEPVGATGLGAFLVRQAAGRVALDAARAGPHLSQAIGAPVSGKSLIVGLSQGGHATLSASTERASYAPELDLRGFAAAAPPDVAAGIRYTAGTTDVPGLVYTPLLLYAWQMHYGLRVEPFLQEPFFSQAPAAFSSSCLFTGDGSLGPLWDFLPTDPTVVMTAPYLTMASLHSWAEPWASLFAENGATPPADSPPIVIFQGLADITVLPAYTEAYVARLLAAGVAIDYREVPGADHVSTAFGPVTIAQVAAEEAITWMRDRLAE